MRAGDGEMCGRGWQEGYRWGGLRRARLRSTRPISTARLCSPQAGQRRGQGEAEEGRAEGSDPNGDAAAERSPPALPRDPGPGAPAVPWQPLGVPRVPVVLAGCAGALEGHWESPGSGLGPALSWPRPPFPGAFWRGGTGGPPLLCAGALGLRCPPGGRQRRQAQSPGELPRRRGPHPLQALGDGIASPSATPSPGRRNPAPSCCPPRPGAGPRGLPGRRGGRDCRRGSLASPETHGHGGFLP